jgi:DNA-binding winged helix-turn-helix (wHTH) protein
LERQSTLSSELLFQRGASETVEFGPFRLRVTERLLEKQGVPLSLGSRALDILIALVERATEVVSKRDLLARVWPDLVVDDGSLRFHIAALRKALGDGQSGARYVSNVAGRGYCFVAPVSRMTSGRQSPGTKLDWNYGLLSPFEQLTLRRLSVFGGFFALEAVQSVSAPGTDRAALVDMLAVLTEKSFVVADLTTPIARYRLLETTRAFLLLKLSESGERNSIARRHAMHCINLIERASTDAPVLNELLAVFEQHRRDVCEALHWSFSQQGDIGIGTTLAAASIPLFSELSLQTADSRGVHAAD